MKSENAVQGKRECVKGGGAVKASKFSGDHDNLSLRCVVLIPSTTPRVLRTRKLRKNRLKMNMVHVHARARGQCASRLTVGRVSRSCNRSGVLRDRRAKGHKKTKFVNFFTLFCFFFEL
jgi:hypothetical protein